MSRENLIQTLYFTTEIGAERPVHKCGNPMAKHKVEGEKQRWACRRRSCNEKLHISLRRYKQSEKGRASDLRYWQSEKGRETRRRLTMNNNARRLYVGGVYAGRV